MLLAVVALVVAGGGGADAKGKPRPKPKRGDPELREELAEMYASQGRYDDAITIYDELRVDAPADLDLLDGLLDACLASAACAPRRIELLGEARKAFPDRTELLEALVNELAAANRPADAEAALAQHLATHPETLALRLLELDLLARLGRAKQLDAALVAASRRYPRAAEVWTVIGERALERGDVASARRAAVRARQGKFSTPDEAPRLAALERDLAQIAAEVKAEVVGDERARRRQHRREDHEADLEPASDY